MITDIDNKDFYLCVGSSISISERRDNSKSDTTWNVLWILVKLTSPGPVWIMQKYILKKLSFHYIYKVDFKKRLENISREMYNFLPKVASFYTAYSDIFPRPKNVFPQRKHSTSRAIGASPRIPFNNGREPTKTTRLCKSRLVARFRALNMLP